MRDDEVDGRHQLQVALAFTFGDRHVRVIGATDVQRLHLHAIVFAVAVRPVDGIGHLLGSEALERTAIVGQVVALTTTAAATRGLAAGDRLSFGLLLHGCSPLGIRVEPDVTL